MSEFKGDVICLDGVIGAGKSTLVKALVADLSKSINPKTGKLYRVAFCLEPVDIWRKSGMLEKFYTAKDTQAFTYAFQTMTFTTRINAMIQALEDVPDADILVTERTVLTDRYVFMAEQRAKLDPALMVAYEMFFDVWKRLLPCDLVRCKFVYLKPSTSSCMKRVRVRGREEEITGVTTDYQDAISKRHDQMFSGKSIKLPYVMTIEGDLANADFSVPGKTLDSVLESIKKNYSL